MRLHCIERSKLFGYNILFMVYGSLREIMNLPEYHEAI